MKALERGERPGQVARLFGISRNTLNLWRQRQARTGSCAAKSGYHKGHSRKIEDWDAFRRFADAHGGQTLAEMAAVLGVGRMTVRRALQKIGYTRKKRPTAIKSATRKSGRSSVPKSHRLTRTA